MRSSAGWDFLKAVRFGRYILNELVRGAHYEGLHSLGRILISSSILGKENCDPASAGVFEGRQIWEVRFKRTCSVELLTRAYMVWAPY